MNTKLKSGFTLVELLAVIGVMIIITTVVVSSSIGMSRGAAYNAARDIPHNVLEHAHQRACMDGKKTIVRFTDNGTDKLIRVFQAEGIVTEVMTDGIADRYCDIAEFSNSDGAGTLVIQNFHPDRDRAAFICNRISRKEQSHNGFDDQGTGDTKWKYIYETTSFHKDSKNATGSYAFNRNDWKEGDSYGFEILSPTRLPVDFEYRGSGRKVRESDDFTIVFYPDGSSDTVTIEITDQRAKGNRGTVKLTVDSGRIELDDGIKR